MGISSISSISTTTTVASSTANASSNASSTANASDTADNLSNEVDTVTALLEEMQDQATLLDILSDDDDDSSSSSNNLIDVLDLSDEAQSLADELIALMDATMQSSIQDSSNQLSDSIAEKVNTALTDAGIDTSEQIDLQVDADGNIVVTNDHSQADAIEEAINNDASLKASLTEYLDFMRTMAPRIAADAQSDGDVTLSLVGSEYMATYVDSTGSSYTLCQS